LHLVAWMPSSMTLSNSRKFYCTLNQLNLSQWHNRLRRHLLTILMYSVGQYMWIAASDLHE
jgi:hypothetical protein